MPRFDWESWVGVKLFSWIAGIALVIGSIYFLRYSIERGWLSPPVRMAIGIAVGVALLVVCELKAARRYRTTANALDAAAVAILFSTFFAAHALWHLLPLPAVFGLMALVTVVAVLLSIRRDSIFIALLGLVGGFATPALLFTGEDRPIGLFGYLLLLNAGLAWVGYRKRWPLLSVLSLVFTVFYQWAWVANFLTPAKLPLAVAIFLVFPVLWLVSSAIGSRGRESPDRLFGLSVAVGSLLPLLFAVYLAAVPAFGARYLLLFGFLFVVAAGLAAIAAFRGPAELHLAGGVMTLVVFATWIANSYRRSAWPGILLIVFAFVALYLAADFLIRRSRLADPISAPAGLTAPLLLFVFPVLVVIEPSTASPGLLFGALFLLLAALAAYAIAFGRGPIYFLGAFFALAAEAVWSGRHLTSQRLIPALLIYGGFALFFLGVPFAARALKRELQPEGGGGVLLFASLALLFFPAAGPVASSSLWGVALLLAILNVGLFLEGSAGRFPGLTVCGLVLSWIVLAVWWANTEISELLIPALAVVGGLAMLSVGGSLWARRRAGEAPAAGVLGLGVYLGLVGHLFLLFVATQKPLSIPPWPFLAVLGVLDLALGVAALAGERGELLVAALGASQLILMTWVVALTGEGRELPVATLGPLQLILTTLVFATGSAPWPSVALVASEACVLMGLAFFALARRRSADVRKFAAACVVAALVGEAVALAASATSGVLPWTLCAIWQIVTLAALLLIAAAMEWHVLAVLAVAPVSAAVFVWREGHLRSENWVAELLFAAAVYLVFFAYPLALGRGARPFREPFLAAVVASVPFFFLARHAMLAGGYGDRIGLLPIAQAAMMVVLLVRLLRLKLPGELLVSRSALVGGAALAFVTVAIPLQLEKQWITIGLAVEGAALSWLYQRLRHKGLLRWSAGLAAAVFVRLALNRAVLSYHPRQGMPVWNWYLYAYLVSAVALYLGAALLRGTDDQLAEGLPRLSTLLTSGATILLFLLLNIEIADYFSTGPAITFNFSAGLAQDLTYTLSWALFGIVLLSAGIALRNGPARVASLVLLVVTIVKCFGHDLWNLGGLYRVGSLVGLAACLALVAIALQKFVLAPERRAP